MKNLLLFLSFFLIGMHLFSQCISIELSVIWKRESPPPPFSFAESDPCVPYLNITYRNNTTDSLYFLKVFQYMNSFPSFCSYGSTIEDYDPTLIVDYSNQNFSIYLDVSSEYLNHWLVFPDTMNRYKEYLIPSINDDLAYIYNRLTYIRTTSPGAKQIRYSPSDLIPEVILDKHKDRFVFLNPGETYTDTLNLFGFKLIKGIFTFNMCSSIPEGVVFNSFWDDINNRLVLERMELPKVVGKYKLFSGSINTNNISIKF